MSESASSALPTREELRNSLRRLEEVLARHRAQAPASQRGDGAGMPAHPACASTALLQQEAERLRALLTPQG